MPINLTTASGQFVQIEDAPLASGGEGAVFRITSFGQFTGCCVKMYLPSLQTVEREQKIRFMINNAPALPTSTNASDLLSAGPEISSIRMAGLWVLSCPWRLAEVLSYMS